MKTGKRKRLERNERKNSYDTCSFIDRHSSALSNSLVECYCEIQSASAERSTDTQVLQTFQAAEEEPPSTSNACKVSHMTSSSVEPVKTHTAKCQDVDSRNCCLGLRKTPPRSSKGCGRVCTACPCGTKVGGVTGNLASKPREKSSPSSPSAKNKTVTTVDAAMKDSVLNSAKCRSASGNSEDKGTRGSQLHVGKNDKVPLPPGTLLTDQPESQPATMEACSSLRLTQDKTCDDSTSSQLETGPQKPNEQNEVKNITPSVPQSSHTSFKIPSELYSSVPLDPEEIKRQERIKRLQDLLQEKEAALEKLKKSM